MSELANNDNKLIDVHKQLEDAKRKQKELLEKQLELRDLPPTWDETRPEILVEVTPTDQEYWVVSDKLRETLPDGWISRVWRIQNRPLYNFYCFHRTRLNTTNGEATDEKHVWHGTSSLDPAMIYNDKQVNPLSLSPSLPLSLSLSLCVYGGIILFKH